MQKWPVTIYSPGNGYMNHFIDLRVYESKELIVKSKADPRSDKRRSFVWDILAWPSWTLQGYNTDQKVEKSITPVDFSCLYFASDNKNKNRETAAN